MDWYQEWMKDGNCYNFTEPDMFFDEEMFDPLIEVMCSECPVKSECLEYALEMEEGIRNGISAMKRFGVWGGLKPFERAKIAKKRKERK